MKKYFLLIALLSFVFLGLGNYSFAVNCSQCQSWCTSQGLGSSQGCLDTCNASCTPAPTPPPPPDPNVTQRQTTCPTATVTIDNYSSINYIESEGICCEENGDGSTGLTPCDQGQLDSNNICTVAGSALVGKPHSKNSITNLSCTCQDGYKQIGKKCEPCNAPGVCCGISLNTSVPFIGNCIESNNTDVGEGEETNVNGENAFPVLMGSLTKILVTVILIVSFVLIIVGGIMIATGDLPGGKALIIKVIAGIALLGASGVILRLINPNFFG